MMNQEDIFKKIGQILSELNDQYQYLAQNPHELNDLELELFLANANFLGDHVQIIKKINSPAVRNILPEHTESQGDQPQLQQVTLPDEEPVTDEEPEADEEPAVLPVKEPELNTFKPVLEEEIFKIDERPSSFEFILSDRPSGDKFEFEEKSIDEIFDRPLSKEEENIIAQKQKLKEKKELEPESPGAEEDEIGPEPFLVTEPVHEEEPAARPAPETPGELFAPVPAETVMPVYEAEPEISTHEPQINRPEPQPDEPVTETPKLTLNDMLAVANNKSINTGGSRMAVTDLKQAISLNDKLRYIKDLFNGYNLAYAEAIDLLNKMPDFKTADAFLQKNYAVKNNWAAKQETAEQFYELLNLRFPAK